MERMKILYIITSTETGGAEKSLSELATFMAQEHQVKVLSLKPLGAVALEMKAAGIEVVSFGMKWYSQSRVIKQIQSEIDVYQPDIIHAMLYRGIEYTRLASAGKNRILVTTLHYDLSKKSLLLRWVDRLLKDLDTLTVAESFSTARYLIEVQKYQKSKVYLLPNGIQTQRFFSSESLRAQMRARYGFKEENIVFVSVARLCPVKDPMTLLEAFRNVCRNNPFVRLVYVGEGPERNQMEKYIRQSHLEEVVFLAGEQTNINDWLNMSDIFVLCSVEESLPLALLEALRVGLPCIVSRVGDMPLWVEHGKNGFVLQPKDLTLLSCFMTEMAQNLDLRREMGQISLDISKRITETSQQYQHLYQQLKNTSFHVKTKH